MMTDDDDECTYRWSDDYDDGMINGGMDVWTEGWTVLSVSLLEEEVLFCSPLTLPVSV